MSSSSSSSSDSSMSSMTEGTGMLQMGSAGGGIQLSEYLDHKEMTENTTVNLPERDPAWTYPLPQLMTLTTLLTEIYRTRPQWPREGIDEDLKVMASQRLYTVADLRDLFASKKRMIQPIEGVPKVLATIMERMVWRDVNVKAFQKWGRIETVQVKDSSESSDSESSGLEESPPEIKPRSSSLRIASTILPIETVEAPSGEKSALPKFRSLLFGNQPETPVTEGEVGDTITLEDIPETRPEAADPMVDNLQRQVSSFLFGDAPPTLPVTVSKSVEPKTYRPPPGRLIAKTPAGTFEYDRACPHKGVDLAKGSVIGTRVICPKHDWEFDLARGGLCVAGGKGRRCTVNAIKLNDW